MSKLKEVIRGPNGIQIVLDPSEIYPNDPGQGTPVLVVKGNDSATYNCASDQGELNDGTRLDKGELWFLEANAEYVDLWLTHAVHDIDDNLRQCLNDRKVEFRTKAMFEKEGGDQ